MIKILSKRFKVGEYITIRTLDNSYSGCIDSFEENCVILSTDQGNVEFISSDSIKGASYKKQINDLKEKIEPNIGEIDKDNEKLNNIPKEENLGVAPPEQGPKIIGFMDTKELERQKKKEAKRNSQFINKKPKSFGTLTDLKKILMPELEEENKKIIPASGIIRTYIADRNFGFIRDEFNCDVWFSFSNIIEDALLELMRGKSYDANIPVLYTLTKSPKGDRAIHIHKPKSVDKAVSIANNLITEKKYDTALGIVEQILKAFPENITAENIKKEIENKRFSKQGFRSKGSGIYNNERYYQKAKNFNTNKNYSESLKYYLLALDNNERRETCIKDIAMLYVSKGEVEKSLEFMNKYEAELPNNDTTYNYLENFYYSTKIFDKVVKNIDLLLNKTKITDKRKYSMYLAKKGFALVQLKKLDLARSALEEAVMMQYENSFASRLLNALDEPDSEELNKVIAEAEFDSFGGGLSKFIKDTLENYDEYFGVPAKVIDSGNFTYETLKGIRNLIDSAGRARPRERANYLLTEAKLMQLLEPDKDIQLRSVLARYCNAMALNHISENSSMDVIRSFYIEAFSLEEQYKLTAPQVALYLKTYKSSYSELIATKTPSIDEALAFLLDAEEKEYIWESILSLFLWNRSISAQLIPKLFFNNLFLSKSLCFLKNIGITYSNITNIIEYTNLWNQAREKRQRDYSKWLASIKSIYANNELEILTGQMYDTLAIARQPWLSQLDNHRLNIISTEILDIANEYLRQSSFDDKERSCNIAKAQINQVISEIQEKPTKFSYEGFIPLLEQILILFDKSFNKVLEASSPIVKVSILGDSSVVTSGNLVPFQICVSNAEESSPIRDIVVEIQDDENIAFIKGNNSYYDSIKGGADCILKLSVKVSPKVIDDKATTLKVKCQYKTRNSDKPALLEQQLSLRLYSEVEYEPIENPYAPLANGGPVTNSKMFYGRDEFIETISQALLKADSKQVIIYGQKRSGKSSVLYHLKKRLEQSNQTFCVLFSLGDIIENLSTTTFFYKICSTIEEELENLFSNNLEVPEYKCPSYEEFRKEPNSSDFFRRQISLFKSKCFALNTWKEKKIIIMIDEFTYLYTAIREGKTSETIMKQWKAVTQNESSRFSVVLVGQDVVPAFKNEEYAKNAFGVIQDIRLTYLSREDAISLIQLPIWDINTNSNRFIARAIESIIDFTACNPYYIQIFCDRLVVYMNRKKIMKVTEADIKEVAESFIMGDQALTPDKFDNLLTAGEKYDLQEIPDRDSVKILRKIATGSKNIGYCPRAYITIGDAKLEEKILKDLTNREVLEKKEYNYKIQVKLFQNWLLKH